MSDKPTVLDTLREMEGFAEDQIDLWQAEYEWAKDDPHAPALAPSLSDCATKVQQSKAHLANVRELIAREEAE